MSELNDLAGFMLMLADAARVPALQHFRQGLTADNKLNDGGFDPVTIADRNAEIAIRALIEQHYPNHNIRGEEFGEKPTNSAWQWIIDPIDGTRAYISGLPVWGVLIGLYFDGKPVLGLMDQPFNDERFVGGPNGTFLYHQNQQQQLQVRNCSNLNQATISTTDPYLFSRAESKVFAQIRQQSRLQRYGLDCYAYCALAMGGIDLVVETDLQDYDIAALIPVIEGAGGQISNWRGGSAANGGQVLATGDKALHQQALKILRPAAR